MTNRRTFIQASLLAATGLTSSSLLAKESKPTTQVTQPSNNNLSKLPLGIIYTQDNPGKWSKKVESHLPMVTLEKGTITITTDHSMSKKHYIVRHTLVTSEGEVLGEKTFSPSDDQAVSHFKIKEIIHNSKENMTLYATSFCNKHDFWLTEITL